MRTRSIIFLSSLYKPQPRQKVWEWARDNVDFSLEPRYETPLHGAYNPDFLPMWKEVQENYGDLTVREQWIIKNSRAGCSENCLLNPLRYIVGVAPRPVQYITGDELSAKRFMDKRIKLGLRCFKSGRGKLNRATANTKYDISFEDMDLVVSWPKNRMAFKQSGYEVILADEVSTWPGFSADMMRKRTDTYRYSHICGISSPDPQQKRGSDMDPIFIEYKGGDQRKWNMEDPVTGNLFKFEMGDKETEWGLKWPAECRNDNDEWDLDAVEAGAYYITPDGTRIEEADRWEVVRNGHWVPENEDAPAGVRSYHINSFYMPFKSGAFGHIARAFLEATRGGPEKLKVFVYEYLAEEWYEQKIEAQDDELRQREENYKRGDRITQVGRWEEEYKDEPAARYITVDVQKAHQWWVCREWINGGDSALIDYGYAVTWEDIEVQANKYEVTKVYVDVGYAQRAMEVYDYCQQYNALPTKGTDEKTMPFRRVVMDPFEGKRGQGVENIAQYNFNTDIFKRILMSLIRGEQWGAAKGSKWMIYAHPERDYVRQVLSEYLIDGEWKLRSGHPDNHLFDCEVLQLLAATIDGVFRTEFNS